LSSSPVGYLLKCRGHPPGQSLGGNFKSPDRSGHQPFSLHPELPPSLSSSVADYSRMVSTRHLDVRSYIVSFCNLIEVLFRFLHVPTCFVSYMLLFKCSVESNALHYRVSWVRGLKWCLTSLAQSTSLRPDPP